MSEEIIAFSNLEGGRFIRETSIGPHNGSVYVRVSPDLPLKTLVGMIHPHTRKFFYAPAALDDLSIYHGVTSEQITLDVRAILEGNPAASRLYGGVTDLPWA